MPNIIYLDCETAGLVGPITLLQYAEGNDNSSIHLVNVWEQPVQQTMELIEHICNNKSGICGFNLSFDWFHICQFYNILYLLREKLGKDIKPINHIRDYVEIEGSEESHDVCCLKPVKALDLMILARKTEFQSLMDRKDIRIKKVPTVLAYELAEELGKRIPLPSIYFARRKKDIDGPQWKVYDRERKVIDHKNNSSITNNSPTKEIDPNLKDVVLKFAASSGLKALAAHALQIPKEEILLYGDIDPGNIFGYPLELEYAPFVNALTKIKYKKTNKYIDPYKHGWPAYIKNYVEFWKNNKAGRQYASDDVKYTRGLHEYFQNRSRRNNIIDNNNNSNIDTRDINNNIDINNDIDTDSELACMIGACRWKGYKIDIEAIKQKYNELTKKLKIDEYNPDHVPTAPAQVKRYLCEVMSFEEQLGLVSTNKNALKDLSTWKLDNNEESKDNPHESTPHPVAIRAKNVIDMRLAKYDLEIYRKLLIAGRLYPDFKVIGTLSGRMSGGGEGGTIEGKRSKKGSINPQGISGDEKIRVLFPLANKQDSYHKNLSYRLIGGDFESFEVAIAEANYNDPNLRKDLLTCGKCKYQFETSEIYKTKCPKCGEKDSRIKIHALMAMAIYPDKTYEQIMKSKKTQMDMYNYGKRAVFGTIYGGDHNTIKTRLNIPIEIAYQAVQRFLCQYTGVAIAQRKIKDAFGSMSQVGGTGTKVVWKDPQDYIESMLGFKRYFTLENKICKTLFDLANNPPKKWQNLKVQVIRHAGLENARTQFVGGAIQSALYAAAFNIQSHNVRAAGNHVIQSTGAEITKETQKTIWDFQPPGINIWYVQPMNVHDEVMCPIVDDPKLIEKVTKAVYAKVETYRPLISLIAIDWKTNLKSWADK